VEKFDLLIKVLRDLQTAGILRHVVLVGSWCQNFYRHLYGNPIEIPATRTLDADLLIPRHLPSSAQGNIIAIMEKNDFAVEIDYPSGYHHFTHPDLKVEFLTDPGPKPDEQIYNIKRKKPEKAVKDIETARGMLMFFEGFLCTANFLGAGMMCSPSYGRMQEKVSKDILPHVKMNGKVSCAINLR
jgi:hypothetical protein